LCSVVRSHKRSRGPHLFFEFLEELTGAAILL